MTEIKTLEGKSALVTGSTSGIGLGIARALAEQGCDIMLNGFASEKQIEEIRAELIDRCGVAVAYCDADLRDPAQIESMMNLANTAKSGIDILVNNAGIQHVSPIEEFATDKWNDIIAVNLTSAFHTTRSVIPSMRSKGWGRIINIASAHALRASPYKCAYVSAKHGLAGLTKTVALEVAEDNITVNAVAPGYVKTPLVTDQVADTARARGISEEEVIRDVILLAQPTKRLIEIEEVAAMVVFLCSEGAASITGAVLPIDGGWTGK